MRDLQDERLAERRQAEKGLVACGKSQKKSRKKDRKRALRKRRLLQAGNASAQYDCCMGATAAAG